MTGATPGPPGISPGGFQQPAQYPNTPSNNQLPLQQPTGGGAAVTPTTNLVFNFPNVASTNSLCPTAISQVQNILLKLSGFNLTLKIVLHSVYLFCCSLVGSLLFHGKREGGLMKPSRNQCINDTFA